MLQYGGMKVIPREAGRVTYSTEIRSLKNIPFTDVQKALVIGSILGDGCLCENWSKTNYRLFINHCLEQKEYLLWKYDVLKNFILSEPRFYARNNSLTIRTISHSELSELRKIFYPKGKKIIPDNIEEFLVNPLVLAIWFMDDGNARKRNGLVTCYDINTQSFNLKENKKLVSVLKDLYGFNVTINLNNGYYRLHISALDKLKFKECIKKFVVDSMKYKLG